VGLERYRKKRRFAKTPEPKGGAAKSPGRRTSRTASKAGRARSFVVQKHAASRLHYDFRLELEGVLKSWAVPKGPSLDPSQKRLAVEVEDHPLEYASFEGVIPKGEYGGGTVLVWDRGTWTTDQDPRRGLAEGKLEFELAGAKLKGSWALVRMRSRSEKDDRNWLLIKHDDTQARPVDEFDVTRDVPASVVKRPGNHGRGRGARPHVVEQPESGAAHVRSTGRDDRTQGAQEIQGLDRSVHDRGARAAAGSLAGSNRSSRHSCRPLLRARSGSTKRSSTGTEPCVASRAARATWFARNGNDWTSKFGVMSPALGELDVQDALLDGEVVVLRPDGTTSFQDLQNAFREKRSDLSYCVFDLLHLEGFDLRPAPLRERKRALQILLPPIGESPAVRYSDHVQGSGEEMLLAACKHRLEGIVSKRLDAPYLSGRGLAWVKSKCSLEQEFVIGGFTSPRGARQKFGALLLGHYEGKRLRFAGRVGTGFDERMLASLHAKLTALRSDESRFVDPPTGAAARGVQWVKPALVGSVRFTGWTEEGMLRHPSFQGLREDKSAREVVREEPRTNARIRRTRPRST